MPNQSWKGTKGIRRNGTDKVKSFTSLSSLQPEATALPLNVTILQAAPDDLIDGNKHPARAMLRKAYRAGQLAGRKSGNSLWVRRSDVLRLVESSVVDDDESEEQATAPVQAETSPRAAMLRRISGSSR